MEQTKKNQWIDRIFFVGLLLAASAVTLLLFHRQTLESSESYHSDMEAYIEEILGLNEKYSYPYPIFFKIARWIHLFAAPELSVALATMLLNSLAMVSIKYFFNKILLKNLQDGLPKCKWLAGVLISLVSMSLFFISMLYPPKGIYLPGILYNYLGVFTANPFHNATYMAARPFAAVTFFLFAKLLGCYEQGYGGKWKNPQTGVAMKDYVLFSLFLLLATMTKPSFTLVMVATAGFIMLYRLFRSKCRNIVPTIQLGVCFVPTFIDLLYQYRGVFVPQEGEEGGVGFCFGEVWRMYCSNIPLAVALAIGFPILVFVCHIGQMKELWKKNSIYRFSWQIYLMGFLTAFFLYEKGFRKQDFNFSWGYMYGIFFGFVGALLLLLKDTADVAAAPKNSRVLKAKLLLGAQWTAYLWHLACGLYYFKDLMQGKMYY
ncbi:MAG: SemiSWEET family transporter [Bacteroidales bacterium]|nr:SemiSWEET family transporter [Lachnoclostridium sp.]MCM1383108.1 SemiSWEET family transporter [Lachnoclostridium sp.]MCM1465400.1 SemiSWEET family transporter [Bacteroidales bacterium]